MTLDITKPDDNDTISTIAERIRETREALIGSNINFATVALTPQSPDIVLPSTGFSTLTVTAAHKYNVQNISNGNQGDIIVLYFDTDNITLIDQKGNILLNGDPAAPDFPTKAGDMITLIYNKFLWREFSRTLAEEV